MGHGGGPVASVLAHHLLWWCEFESAEVFSFFAVKLFDKTENKRKTSVVGPSENNTFKRFWQQTFVADFEYLPKAFVQT